jgi:hypothetical protein
LLERIDGALVADTGGEAAALHRTFMQVVDIALFGGSGRLLVMHPCCPLGQLHGPIATNRCMTWRVPAKN